MVGKLVKAKMQHVKAAKRKKLPSIIQCYGSSLNTLGERTPFPCVEKGSEFSLPKYNSKLRLPAVIHGNLQSFTINYWAEIRNAIGRYI